MIDKESSRIVNQTDKKISKEDKPYKIQKYDQ